MEDNNARSEQLKKAREELRKKTIEKKLAKAKKNKYNYYNVLQGFYGNRDGWEDECQYQADSTGLTIDRKEMKEDLKAYRENSQFPTRIVFRKELKTA